MMYESGEYFICNKLLDKDVGGFLNCPCFVLRIILFRYQLQQVLDYYKKETEKYQTYFNISLVNINAVIKIVINNACPEGLMIVEGDQENIFKYLYQIWMIIKVDEIKALAQNDKGNSFSLSCEKVHSINLLGGEQMQSIVELLRVKPVDERGLWSPNSIDPFKKNPYWKELGKLQNEEDSESNDGSNNNLCNDGDESGRDGIPDIINYSGNNNVCNDIDESSIGVRDIVNEKKVSKRSTKRNKSNAKGNKRRFFKVNSKSKTKGSNEDKQSERGNERVVLGDISNNKRKLQNNIQKKEKGKQKVDISTDSTQRSFDIPFFKLEALRNTHIANVNAIDYIRDKSKASVIVIPSKPGHRYESSVQILGTSSQCNSAIELFRNIFYRLN